MNKNIQIVKLLLENKSINIDAKDSVQHNNI